MCVYTPYRPYINCTTYRQYINNLYDPTADLTHINNQQFVSLVGVFNPYMNNLYHSSPYLTHI